MQISRFFVAILILLTVLLSCRKDFDYAPGNGKLEFSQDTVFLDTVFTNIGSATHLLKVYNRSNDDILIPNIHLAGGPGSSYRLNVDGQAGTDFQEIPLLARDSLYVFVETTFDISPLQTDTFLYTDAIVFDGGAREQRVALVTLVKDAIFLYPGRNPDGSRETVLLGRNEDGISVAVPGFELQDNQLLFSNDKPYVIYGYASAGAGQQVRVAAGARLYFHKDSGLFIGEGASLLVEGRLSQDLGQMEQEVVFEGDRPESDFKNVAGQWGGVWLGAGSGNHQIEYLSILNATVGLLAEGSATLGPSGLLLRNTQIKNSASINLHAVNIDTRAENLVLGNAADAALRCEGEGPFNFTHCTIANYWSQGPRTGPAVQLAAPAQGIPQQTRFTSCILAGNNARELRFSGDSGQFATIFSHCTLRFEDTGGVFASDPLYDFNDPAKYPDTLLNLENDFLNTAGQDYRIGFDSGGIGKADSLEAQNIPLDLAGVERVINPDVGAYQAMDRNEIVIGSTKM
jgi:hypothetical protein